jgi:hypothetical protein
LDKEFKKRIKYQKPGPDVVETAARMRKGKPGKSFIELNERINRSLFKGK